MLGQLDETHNIFLIKLQNNLSNYLIFLHFPLISAQNSGSLLKTFPCFCMSSSPSTSNLVIIPQSKKFYSSLKLFQQIQYGILLY